MKIYNKYIVISVFLVFMPYCCAVEGLKEPVNKVEVLKSADNYFNTALNQNDKVIKLNYLKLAQDQYYVISTLEKHNIYPLIQLARINDLLNNDRYAKAYFSSALGVDNTDVNANYYFGDFYYRRKNYRLAMKYYKLAFEYGINENPENVLKMAGIYEKLGDLNKAEIYYKRAFLLNKSDNNIANKIREIEDIKYKNTKYYNRGNKTK